MEQTLFSFHICDVSLLQENIGYTHVDINTVKRLCIYS